MSNIHHHEVAAIAQDSLGTIFLDLWDFFAFYFAILISQLCFFAYHLKFKFGNPLGFRSSVDMGSGLVLQTWMFESMGLASGCRVCDGQFF
jgi:hypothetical protein